MTRPHSPEAHDTGKPTPHPQAASAPAGAACDLVQAMLHCPVCACRLQERRCKLSCPQCGYYMSCADYY